MQVAQSTDDQKQQKKRSEVLTVLEFKAKCYGREPDFAPETGNGEKRIGTMTEHANHAVIGPRKVEKILVPTDLSPVSRAGIHYALNAATALDAEVIIYYVITGNEVARFRRPKEEAFADFDDLLKAYEMRLRSFVEQNFDEITSVEVSQKVEFGTPEEKIIETAKTEGVDLIIMATRGMSGLSRIVLGSVTEQVIRNAPCPVVAIPPYFSVGRGDSNAALD
jgi:nucleotide-binding universal stress UspA family protein